MILENTLTWKEKLKKNLWWNRYTLRVVLSKNLLRYIVVYFGRFLKKRCKIAILNFFDKIVYRSENFLRSNHLYDAYMFKEWKTHFEALSIFTHWKNKIWLLLLLWSSTYILYFASISENWVYSQRYLFIWFYLKVRI